MLDDDFVVIKVGDELVSSEPVSEAGIELLCGGVAFAKLCRVGEESHFLSQSGLRSFEEVVCRGCSFAICAGDDDDEK